MRLADWLDEKKIKRQDFAEKIGVSRSLVSQLCNGAVWPGRDVAARISQETDGAVTANDFVERSDAAGSGEAAA